MSQDAVGEADTGPAPVADPGEEERGEEETAEAASAAAPVVPVEMPVEASEPVAVPPPPVQTVTPAEVATRFCPVCDERVPVDVDGLHCHLGHRLSPAHARTGWFRRRRG